MTINIKLISAFILILAFASESSQAAEKSIEVTLSSPASLVAKESGKIVVTITNRGHQTLLLPEPKTPVFNPDNHLMGDYITVIGDDGKKPKFIGRFVKMSFKEKKDFYFPITPGQTLSKEIDLSKDYDLRAGGKFRVSYEQDYGDTTLYDTDDYAPNKSISNELIIFVSPELVNGNTTGQTDRSDYIQPQCDIYQDIDVLSAENEAMKWDGYAISHLMDGLETVDKTVSEDGRYKTLYSVNVKNDSNYIFWFGTPDNNREFIDTPPSPGYFDLDYTQIDFRPIGVLRAVAERINTVPYGCGCDPAKYKESTLAWYDQSKSSINYCESFFKAPLALSEGQASTIIHEMTHVADSLVDKTTDYKYGRKDAHELATANRNEATNNADNYNFFVESINSIP
ncbi:M35 family metallo-endopeptidase [Dyella koreensis]|uniref:Lysine-specific metallo-endopeptidase domain-containing protein n=1 Tax=Dyella koreensis TaxID=311235 RepID=A0ABW8K9Q1_9GAMM